MVCKQRKNLMAIIKISLDKKFIYTELAGMVWCALILQELAGMIKSYF